MKSGLWEWINGRDHWTKEPSVAEKFDVFLRLFTEHSLKDDAQLWKGFMELRKARNALAHEGTAKVGSQVLGAGRAQELLNGADKIIKWVELLLPEARRRIRTEASGPFSRRLATVEESAVLDPSAIDVKAYAQNQGQITLRRNEEAEHHASSDHQASEAAGSDAAE